MTDGYTAFLVRLKDVYPETYLKIIEFPDPVVIGWINEIANIRDMITLQSPEKVKGFFDVKIAVSGVILNTKFKH